MTDLVFTTASTCFADDFVTGNSVNKNSPNVLSELAPDPADDVALKDFLARNQSIVPQFDIVQFSRESRGGSMYKTLKPVAWSTIWSFIIPVPMVWLLPIPSTAIMAYVLGAVATGASVLLYECVDSSAARKRHDLAVVERRLNQ